MSSELTHRPPDASPSATRERQSRTVEPQLRDASESGQTATERAYQEVRQRILDGRLPAGRRLKELDLARELGISRTPVRDALTRLNVEGLLDFRPNLGATVSVWSEAQIEQMFRIRAMLEPFAAEIAAGEIADEEIAELRSLCGVMEEAARRETSADLIKLAAANARFHKSSSTQLGLSTWRNSSPWRWTRRLLFGFLAVTRSKKSSAACVIIAKWWTRSRITTRRGRGVRCEPTSCPGSARLARPVRGTVRAVRVEAESVMKVIFCRLGWLGSGLGSP